MLHRFSLASASSAALAAALFASPARAIECETTADCPDSFACEVTATATCPGVACPPGEPCPAPEPCESKEYRECVPGPCESDADCGEGMQCHVSVEEICSGVSEPCDPAADTCESTGMVTCTETTHAQCVYAHELPCTVDADCGIAFQCVELESCWCDGGGGSTPSAGGTGGTSGGSGSGGAAGSGSGDFAAPAPEPIPPPDCGCAPSGETACVPREIPCADDSECPESWSCESTGGGTDCTATDPAGGAPSGPICLTEPEEFRCVPPSTGYYDYGYGQPGSDGGGTTGEGSVGSGGTTSTPTPEPEEPNGADPGGAESDVMAQGASDSGDSGSCSIPRGAPGGASGGASALLLLGLAGAWRRRRGV